MRFWARVRDGLLKVAREAFSSIIEPRLAAKQRVQRILALFNDTDIGRLLRDVEALLGTQRRFVAAMEKSKTDERVPESSLGSAERDRLREDLSRCHALQVEVRQFEAHCGSIKQAWAASANDTFPGAQDLVASIQALDSRLVMALGGDLTPATPLNDGLLEHSRALRRRLEEPRMEFLKLPGREGRVYLGHIFRALGEHPYVGIGAIGGLVAVFGLAKATAEQHHTGVNLFALMTTGDIASVGARLSVPFALLVAALLVVAYFWTRTLESDHTRPLQFARRLVVPSLALAVPAAAFWVWSPPRSFQAADYALLVFAACAVLPAIALLIAGRITGVVGDDVIQLGMLRVFRELATTTPGLLSAFAVVGAAILFTERISVSFVKADVGAVVQTKTSDTAIPVARFARVNDVWLFEAASPSQASGGNSSWFLISNGEIRCMSGAPTVAGHTAVDSPCAARPPARRLPATIAGYSARRFDCAPESFGPGRYAAIAKFPSGVPARGMTTLPGVQWIPAERLRQRDLGPPVEDAKGARAAFDATRAEPNGTTWVLGFASRKGAPSGNTDLSERRARALSSKLSLRDAREAGIGEGLLTTYQDEDSDEQRIAVAFVCVAPAAH
jgi:hypothetical protein